MCSHGKDKRFCKVCNATSYTMCAHGRRKNCIECLRESQKPEPKPVSVDSGDDDPDHYHKRLKTLVSFLLETGGRTQQDYSALPQSQR